MATAELQTINSVLKNKDVAALYGPSVDDLFSAYKPVWEDIKDYHHRYHALPDIETMQERYPSLEDVPVKGPTQFYVERLKSEYLAARMDSLASRVISEVTPANADEILNKFTKAVLKLNRFSSNSHGLNIMDFDAAERHYEALHERSEAMGGTPGIPTGISFIDSAYPSGLAAGDLVVVLGFTGRGKSQFTTLVSANAHDRGHVPMIVSLEMSGEKVRDRIYTIMGSGLFRHSDLMLGSVNVDDFRSFKNKHTEDSDFYVISGNGIDELTPSLVGSLCDQYRPSMVTIDYAQLGSDDAQSPDMTSRMRNMSKQYKALAVAKQIPVVLISSATPESGTSVDGPPMVEQVAWSKQLAYDADLAFAVHKYDDSNLIELACRKNRNGPLFSGFLDWDLNTGQFKEVFDI